MEQYHSEPLTRGVHERLTAWLPVSAPVPVQQSTLLSLYSRRQTTLPTTTAFDDDSPLFEAVDGAPGNE